MFFRRVMVILNIEVKVPGKEVGHKIGNPTNAEPESDSKPAQSVQSKLPSHPQQQNGNMS